MRTCFWNRQSKKSSRLRRLSCIALLALSAVAGAQTLARPGWAGSGVAIEPWWRRAVFYRIDPAQFQDSDGDGKGDLSGIAQRLGYLQSFGVDAIVLRLPPASTSSELQELQSGFESLARAAAEHKLRVLVELTAPADDSSSEASYLNAAHFWLNQGAAGIDLDTAAFTAAGDDHAAAFVHTLHTLLNEFSGGRILIANAAPAGDPALAKALAQRAQLVPTRPFTTDGSASALRREMEAALGVENTSPTRTHTTRRHRSRERAPEHVNAFNPLWSASRVKQPVAPDLQLSTEREMATLLLASRAAVMIDYGEEIGLEGGPDSLMQWTPKNVTPRAPAPIERPAAAAITDRPVSRKPKPRSDVYGSYVPYVPPAKAKPPETDTPAKIDPDTLPGFTSGVLPAPAPGDAATVNVAVEEADPHSLLNLYRKLIQLHHGNASVHNGAETVLNHDDLNALVWVRRPPAGAATATTVVAVCNLSEKPVDLSLGDELKLRGGVFRTLVGDAKVSDERVSVPAGAVWVGEWRIR